MEKLILKRQTGGNIPLKFDRPLKLEEIPTQNKLQIIDNYSPKYNYIVEEDKIYYAQKGRDHWVDISDNEVARTNLYNFLGNKYDFRGYNSGEKDIWNQIKSGSFNYQQYRENKNKVKKSPQTVAQSKPTQSELDRERNRLVRARVGTSGGGFTFIEVPAYMVERQGGWLGPKPEYHDQVYEMAKQRYPYKYADPIDNIFNWAPVAILTRGRAAANLGYDLITPIVSKGAQKVYNLGSKGVQGVYNLGKNAVSNISNTVTSKVTPAISNFIRSTSNYLPNIPKTISNTFYSTPARRALTKATVGAVTTYNTVPIIAENLKIKDPGSSEIKQGWNMLMDGDVANLWKASTAYLDRQADKRFGGDDVITNLTLPIIPDNPNSKYAFRPEAIITGDTIQVPKNNRRYIIPEALDVSSLTFKHRNRGDYTPIESEAAIITVFNPFVSYEQRNRYKSSKTFIGYNSKTGELKAGDISQFGPGDYLTPSYSNDFTGFAKDSSGNLIYKNDAAHDNASRSVPVMITPDGKKGSLNILTDLDTKGNQKGKVYGNVAGGRVLVKVGDEFRLLSGSIENIYKQFEEMKKRNHATYGTFYALDNGTYNRGLRTYDKKFTSADLKNYDDQHQGGGGNFLYIISNPKFKSDTIWTPKIRTKESESYIKGHPLTNSVQGVVLHHTGQYPSLDAIVQDLTTPAGKPIPWRIKAGYTKPDDILSKETSAHVIIGEDGTRKVLATPDKVTFHTGQSIHNGKQNVNDFMIGIEFQGDTNKKDLTPQQIKSAIEYLEPILRKNNIRLEDIVTHQNVRDLYNDYARKAKQKEAPTKPDINQKNYNLIIQELLKKVYYKK